MIFFSSMFNLSLMTSSNRLTYLYFPKHQLALAPGTLLICGRRIKVKTTAP